MEWGLILLQNGGPIAIDFIDVYLGNMHFRGRLADSKIQAVRKIRKIIHTRKYIVWLLLG